MEVSITFKHYIGFVSSIFAIIAGIFILSNFIDNKIDQKINDPNYIEKISLNLNSYLIFKSNKQIIYDHGALQYFDNFIDNISIEKPTKKKKILIPDNKNEYEADFLITIEFNKLFTTAPILEAKGFLQSQTFPIKGEGKKWEFYILLWSQIVHPEDLYFRLELLK